MDPILATLSSEEKIVFELRSLYQQSGYSKYKMSKFEEYDLYANNKDFLVSDHIITFTDTNGKLMALKPDVTLSIVRSSKDSDALRKVYYNENVYRVSPRSKSFQEIMQTGLECIGPIDDACVLEVVGLAKKSLGLISEDFVLTVSDLDLLYAALDALQVTADARAAILACVAGKNPDELKRLCGEYGADPEAAEFLQAMASVSGEPEEALAALQDIGFSEESLAPLKKLTESMKRIGEGEGLRIDLSLAGDMNYYNGIVFQGYVNGIPSAVLSGGRYDRLMRKMGKKSGAIGFAVYMDLLERYYADQEESEAAEAAARPAAKSMINIALPKGRMGEKVYRFFAQAGLECPDILEDNRKLIFENGETGVRYFWVKPSDVAVYVERGAADIGVCGKDILLEYEPDVYELLDLKTGICHMSVAGPADFKDDPRRTLRVATKFMNIATDYYAKLGRDIDIIHLNGSIELAPLLELSDVIVDLVETGTTLRENGLKEIETILPVSSRVIANKASYEFKSEAISRICGALAKQVKTDD